MRRTPRLVRATKNFNIVAFDSRYYGVPQGINIDWQRDDLSAIPRVVIGESVEQVESAIP
jgi:hypothetical protein